MIYLFSSEQNAALFVHSMCTYFLQKDNNSPHNRCTMNWPLIALAIIFVSCVAQIYYTVNHAKGAKGDQGEGFSVDFSADLKSCADFKTFADEYSDASPQKLMYWLVGTDSRPNATGCVVVTDLKNNDVTSSDLSGHVIVYNGTTWRDYGTLGTEGASGPLSLSPLYSKPAPITFDESRVLEFSPPSINPDAHWSFNNLDTFTNVSQEGLFSIRLNLTLTVVNFGGIPFNADVRFLVNGTDQGVTAPASFTQVNEIRTLLLTGIVNVPPNQPCTFEVVPSSAPGTNILEVHPSSSLEIVRVGSMGVL